MEAFRSSPRDGDGSRARERVHMQGEDSLAAARARWAKLQPENLQHVQDSRRIDREQQARQQSDQTPRVTLLGSGVQQQHSSKLIGYAVTFICDRSDQVTLVKMAAAQWAN